MAQGLIVYLNREIRMIASHMADKALTMNRVDFQVLVIVAPAVIRLCTRMARMMAEAISMIILYVGLSVLSILR